MCASKNTIFSNIYHYLNAPHVTFYRKIVHFQIFEYANELICIIFMKYKFNLAWIVEIVRITYHNTINCNINVAYPCQQLVVMGKEIGTKLILY